MRGNDKRHKMNSNNNRLKHPIYQLHYLGGCATFMQSMMNQLVGVYNLSVICATCKYYNNFCLMQNMFFQIIPKRDREEHLYVNFHRGICSI